jgi:hypothetical protein
MVPCVFKGFSLFIKNMSNTNKIEIIISWKIIFFVTNVCFIYVPIC